MGRRFWLMTFIRSRTLYDCVARVICVMQLFLTSSMRHPVSQPSQSGQVEQWFDGVLLF